MKKLTALLACLSLLACGSTTAGVAVAAFGVAGVGLETYCAVATNGCSAALLAYGVLVTTQATQDATILESGATTATQINSVLANLNAALQTGNALPGVSPAQQQKVSAIVNAITVLTPLIEALVTTTPATVSAVRGVAPAIVLPPLSAKDLAALAKMQAAIAGARK